MEIKELMPLMKMHGRTLYVPEKKVLFTNWSCSGFSIGVKGSYLKAKVVAIYDQIPDIFNRGEPPKDWPCLGLTIDGGEELIYRELIDVEEKEVELYKSDKQEEHEFRFIKLNENARGKLGFVELITDGEFFATKDGKQIKIEIIGDSITCGFGNEAQDNKVFKTSEENGWSTYAAKAARKLGYEFSMICESGINAIKPEHPMFPMHAMEDIYDYQDELLATKLGIEKQLHKFENDIVVISLGTNDSNPIRFGKEFNDIEPMEEWFEKRYIEFLKQIRKANGEKTLIMSCLGPINYYLYYRIYNAVNKYKEETGDKNICCFQFFPVNEMFEGIGAMGHPSQKTHDRMADELVNYVKKFYGEK